MRKSESRPTANKSPTLWTPGMNQYAVFASSQTGTPYGAFFFILSGRSCLSETVFIPTRFLNLPCILKHIYCSFAFPIYNITFFRRPWDFKKFLAKECRYNNMDFPEICVKFCNLRRKFCNFYGVKRVNIELMLKNLGQTFDG